MFASKRSSHGRKKRRKRRNATRSPLMMRTARMSTIYTFLFFILFALFQIVCCKQPRSAAREQQQTALKDTSSLPDNVEVLHPLVDDASDTGAQLEPVTRKITNVTSLHQIEHHPNLVLPHQLCRFNRRSLFALTKNAANQCGLPQLGFSPGLEQLFYRNPKRFHSDVLSSRTGAIRINQLYEQGNISSWYPEYQLHGADFVQAGLVLGNETLVQRGLFVLNWAVERLHGVEKFEKIGDDAKHSVSFFFEAAGRAALLLKSFQQCSAYNDQYLVPLLRRLASWAKDPYGDSMGGQRRFTHIALIRTAGYLYLTHLVQSSDREYNQFVESARQYLNYSLSKQWMDGTYPEKDGFDVHYQGFSVMFGSRLLALVANSSEYVRMGKSVEAGVRRLLRNVEQDGSLNASVSVRVNREFSRDGKPKTIDYKSAIHGLLYASYLLDNPLYYQAASRVARFKYCLKGRDRLKGYRKAAFPWRRCQYG